MSVDTATMAKMKRSTRKGLGGADLTETLGSLLRSTLEQAGVVREVLERGARTGRARLDEARAGRRRSTALAELGEIVLELVRSGEVELEELPEIADIVAELDRIDADAEGGAEDRSGRADWSRSRSAMQPGPAPFRGPSRDESSWPDDRSRSAAAPGARAARPTSVERRTEPRAPTRERVWRPENTVPVVPPMQPTQPGRDRVPRPTQPESLAARLRREADGTLAALRQATPEPATDDRQLAYGNAPRGGISFDDDLQEYMHPDDVPSDDEPSKP